jgi:hypothetical protein
MAPTHFFDTILMMRPSERLKQATIELAESFASNHGFQVLRQIKRVLYASDIVQETSQSNAQVPAIGRKHRIGIWEPIERNGERHFVRSLETGEPASLWANVHRIPPKGTRRRVLLLGESVARGFLFDPHFNPSMVLQKMLRGVSEDRELEVIDLARTDLLLQPLVELAKAAVDLTPDAVIVLAGNNWAPILNLTSVQFQETAAILVAGAGWAEVKAFLENLLRAHVDSCIKALTKLARAYRFALVLVIPEFNLSDWHTNVSNPPLLSTTATAKWHWLRAEAESSLSSAELGRAEHLARQILELDGGTTPVGSNIIAEVKLRGCVRKDAREFLEMARDSVICWPRLETPRCYSVIQQTIRKEAVNDRFILVDLPRVFQSYCHDGLPDRRIFLDYCHFTVEGTHVAMAAVAQALLSPLFNLGGERHEIRHIKFPVSASVEGEAHFLAAIHNANWGQSVELIQYHCRRAIARFPEITRMMRLFLDFHLRRAPHSLCKTFEELCQLQSLSAISLLFNPNRPLEEKFLNERLIGEMTQLLEADLPGVRAISCLLDREHGVQHRVADLLNKKYSSDSFIRALDTQKYGYYKAHDRCSRFALVCDAREPVELTVTYRCPPGLIAEERIAILVQGVRVDRISLSLSWTTVRLIIPAAILREGINSIEIVWPMPQWDLASWKDEIAQRLESGEFADVNPVFGELFRLEASVYRGPACCSHISG